MRILVLVVLGLLSVSGVGAQADLPPYIHYFDPLRGGLVIERADGTDSRIIMDVPMDAGPPVWSPSGKWMVISHMIVSTDGSKRIEMPEPSGIYDTVKALWSADDLLLTVRDEEAAGMSYVRITDPETGATLAEIDLEGGDNYSVKMYWDDDGERAFVGWPGRVVMLTRDGHTEILGKDAELLLKAGPIFDRGRLFVIEQLADGRLMELVSDTDRTQRIEIGEATGVDPLPSYFIRWSPTMEHVLIYRRNCSPSGDCETSLKLVDWQSGSVQTITPTMPIAQDDFECLHYFKCTELWSLDGRYALLSDPYDLYSENSQVFLLDVSTGETRQIAAAKKVIYYRWSPNGQVYFITADDQNLYQYDPVEDTTIDIEVPVPVQYQRLFPSPDGRLIGVTAQPPTVIDKSGAIISQTPQHSFSTGALCCPSDYQWDATSEWVMPEYSIFFAGGGHSEPDAAVLIDIEGTTRRELPFQGRSGFVPARAVPYLSPGQPQSDMKAPLFVLPQAGLFLNVGWHPTDPDRLVTFSAEDGLVFWSLASGSPEVTERMPVNLSREQAAEVEGVLYWLPENDTIGFISNGRILAIDPQLDSLSGVNEVDTPRLVQLSEGQAIQYSLSGQTIMLDTTVALTGLHRLASDYSGMIAWDNGEISKVYFYVDAESGRVVPLEMPTTWFTPHTVDARDGVAFLGSIYDCCVTVVSTEDGHIIDRFHGTAVSLAISADGRRLATTSAGMTAIWDISEYMVGE